MKGAGMAKVLIVEDETLIRFSLADALIDAGHVVIDCGNVLEAVAALARHEDIAAVVTDVDMPGGLSGLDLAALVRKTRPSVPLIVTSGRAIDLSRVEDAAFLAKPYDFAALARSLSERLEQGGRKTSLRPGLSSTRYRAL
jgi:DNA-binding NtrC family response regulator